MFSGKLEPTVFLMYSLLETLDYSCYRYRYELNYKLQNVCLYSAVVQSSRVTMAFHVPVRIINRNVSWEILRFMKKEKIFPNYFFRYFIFVLMKNLLGKLLYLNSMKNVCDILFYSPVTLPIILLSSPEMKHFIIYLLIAGHLIIMHLISFV